MLGAALALAAAATFGFNNVTLRRGVLTGSALQALMVTVPMGVPLFALGALAFGALGGLLAMSGEAVLWFSVAGVLHFIIGRYGNYRATRALGANLSGPVQQTGVLVALALAMIYLGEQLSLLSFIGIALVLFGPFVMLQGRRGVPTPSGFVPDYGPGLFWGVINALGHGASPLFVAWGLDGAGIGFAMLGGLVSYAAAATLLLVLILFPVPRRHVAAMDGVSARWFAVSGFFVFVSQMFRYAALAVAPVSVVAPIQRLSVVFRVVFGWVMNREHEVFDWRVLAGIALSLLGALLLTLSVDWVGALLPPGARDALDWRWP